MPVFTNEAEFLRYQRERAERVREQNAKNEQELLELTKDNKSIKPALRRMTKMAEAAAIFAKIEQVPTPEEQAEINLKRFIKTGKL